jgi:diguanylate cyclase (GGDEF)-like protein
MGILIVDDDAQLRRLLSAFLCSAGCESVSEARSAEEAFALVGLGDQPDSPLPSFDVILMDIHLPGVSGIEACRRLKADEHVCDVPVLMVTASNDMALLRTSFEVGACDYIIKPIRRVELLVRVKAAVRLSQEMKERKVRERDILEQKRFLEHTQRKLERIAGTDALTGIANRRRFEEAYAQEWSRAQRNGSSLSLALVDIDAFKGYNDSYGHQRGDDCLHAVAQALAATAQRSADFVARYGGEEFAVILPGLDEDAALDMARRLHQAVAALNIPHEASPAADCVTVSIGIATTVPTAAQPVKDLINRADTALYRSKTAGRNRVTVAPASLPQSSICPGGEDAGRFSQLRSYA